MTFASITLENFEEAPQPEPESEEYRLGFEAGQQSALALAEADRVAAINAASATLADMAFSFVEAQTLVEQMLRPLVVQLAEVALPSLLQDSFGAHLTEVIMNEFELMTAERLVVHINPEAASALEASMPPEITAKFTFKEDPQLDAGQALITQSGRNVIVDLPGLTEELQQALLGLSTDERATSHG